MKKILLIVSILLIAGIAWYGLSPLLDTKKVNDELPTLDAQRERNQNNPESAVDPSPLVSITRSVAIADTPLHPASGQVRIVETGRRKILRYENYKTINGPDVRVYLATDKDAKEFVDLGPIKGTEGDINYDIPEGTDLEKYHFALTWCEDFNVLFNSADLSQK
jgi:hypothetical protein